MAANSDYDGTSFIGIHSDSYDEDSPADAWVQQRMDGNLRYLVESRRACAIKFPSPAGDLSTLTLCKPWASVDWSCICMFPYLLLTDLITLRFGLVGAVSCQGATNADLDVWIKLKTARGLYLAGRGVASNTEADTPVVQDHVFTFDLSRVEQPTKVRVEIWIKSQIGAEYDADSPAYSSGYAGSFVPLSYNDDDASGHFADTGGTRPDADSLDIRAGKEPDGLSHYDVLYNYSDNVGIVYPYQEPIASGSLETRDYISYIQLRSIWVEEVFDKARTKLVQAPEALRARIPNRGETWGRHFEAYAAVYDRPIPLMLHHSGTVDTGLEQYTDYHVAWPWVMATSDEVIEIDTFDAASTYRVTVDGTAVDTPGDTDKTTTTQSIADNINADATVQDLVVAHAFKSGTDVTSVDRVRIEYKLGGGSTVATTITGGGTGTWFSDTNNPGKSILVQEMLAPFNTQDPLIEVQFYVIGVLFDHFKGTSLGSLITEDYIRENAVEVDWTFTARMTKLEDGDTDWVTSTDVWEETKREVITHYPTQRWGSEWPFLLQQYWIAGGAAGTGDGEVRTMREGHLYENDLKFVRSVTVPVPIDQSTSTEIGTPARLQLRASCNEITWQNGETSGPHDKVRLVLVGGPYVGAGRSNDTWDDA